MFYNQAKKEGLIDGDFKVSPLYTHETPREFVYGVLAYINDWLTLKRSGNLKKAAEKKYRRKVGKFFKSKSEK